MKAKRCPGQRTGQDRVHPPAQAPLRRRPRRLSSQDTKSSSLILLTTANPTFRLGTRHSSSVKNSAQALKQNPVTWLRTTDFLRRLASVPPRAAPGAPAHTRCNHRLPINPSLHPQRCQPSRTAPPASWREPSPPRRLGARPPRQHGGRTHSPQVPTRVPSRE